MNQPYIFESEKNKKIKNSEAIIILPDIYCQTEYSKNTVEKFADLFNRPVFMLDYFYLSTGKANDFAQDDRETVRTLMQNFKGDGFVDFFKKAVLEIKEAYPNITQFIIIGFCFGGRLAYIAGGEDNVTKVISFYGAGAHTPGFVLGKTPIEYLAEKRKNSDLTVVSFYGTQDGSIPDTDRIKTKEALEKAGISYTSHEYNTGHAYFQEGRASYDAKASVSSWEVLKEIL